jgi:hypothetical protein
MNEIETQVIHFHPVEEDRWEVVARVLACVRGTSGRRESCLEREVDRPTTHQSR